MRKITKIVLMLFLLIRVTPSIGQIDTCFWFACPFVTPDHTFRQDYKMHIGTFNTPNTVVRLRQPSAIAPNIYDTTINIPANTNFDYTFWRDKMASLTNRGFDSLEVRPSNTVVPYGFYISSSANITIVYDVITSPPTFYNPETFSLKGQNGLGLEFVCPFQTSWHNEAGLGDLAGTPPGVVQPKQQINIVASQPNTLVWITPKCAVVGHPANITYSVLLTSFGSAYTVENLVQNTNVAGNNLSGSIVVSDKPISVTVADDSVDGVTGCFDLMGDQIVPVDIVGTDYIMNKGLMNPAEPDGAFIVGTQNFTQLTINDGVTTTTLINKGDTYHYHSTQPITYINATKPVYMLHATGVGSGCELGEAILPPLNCAGSNLVSFSRNTAQDFFLNLLCKNGAQGSFTLNNAAQSVNVPITAANFTLAPGTATLPGGPYYGAQLNLNSTALLPLGSYTVANTTDIFGMGVLDGGPSTGGLYYYASSFLRRTTVIGGTLASVCAGPNVTVPLTGTVSGGAISGVWTTANGTGSFGAYTSTLNTVSVPYTLSNVDTSLVSIKFYLTSTGNCTPKKDSVILIINQRPQITAAVSTPTMCKNQLGAINLTGSITHALGGTWSGGNGGSYGGPGVNTTYTPSAADLAAGTITLTITSQGPLGSCANSTKSFTVGFIDPPQANLITNTVACTNSQSIALTGTVTGNVTSYLWSTNGTGFFSPSSSSLNVVYNFTGADLLLPSITVVLQPFGACPGYTDNMVINIQPKPTLTISPDFTICASNAVITLTSNISGGGAGATTWSTTNGTGAFTPIPPTGANYNVSQNDTLAGIIKFYVNSSGGFCPSVSDTLVVSIIKLPLITVNASTGVCEFTPIQLNGSVAGYVSTGIWSSSGTGSFSPNNTSLGGLYYPSPGDVSAGSVTITLSSTPVVGINCPASLKSFTATFVESPQANISVTPKRCVGDPVGFTNISTLNNTTITAVNWNFGNGITSIATASAQTSYDSSKVYLVTFTVVGTNSLNISCSDTLIRKISINGLPIPDFSYTSSCAGLLTDFSNVSIPGNGNFTWSFGTTVTATPNISTIQTPSITFNSSGIFPVTLTEMVASSQCTASVTKTVSVNPKPKAEFGMTNNPTVAQEPVYYSDFSTPPANIKYWFWNFGDEKSDTKQNPSHSYENGGMYYVTLTITDNNGCKDTVTKSIEVNLIPQVPTGFTPNKDGHNDKLFVKGGPFNKMIFRVYNTWGDKIYESADQTEGWDGTYKGVDQPFGVYVWTLEVDLYNNRTVKKNGDVTLMR